jgi:glycosyltransferase involved in cell wall biosynthesis
MTEKIKILTLSDHPLSPSGVGTQTKYIIEGLLKTGRYQVISLGGAIKHQDYTPLKVEGYEDDWMIFPVDGYGSQDQIRSVLHVHRPDILWFMTDPRFYGWLWDIENEIRTHVPMVYYHVWDNFPYPEYNKGYYQSNDYIACISKVTHDVVNEIVPLVDNKYIPHAVDTNIFKKANEEEAGSLRKDNFKNNPDKFVAFWNNRNARRKQSGAVIWWWKQFLDEVGHENATLIMHTETKDQHGQDLDHIMYHLRLTEGQLVFSRQKLPPEELAKIYSMADCTINVADAEGFGLATLESLACETPIMVTMTGGLQEQVTETDKITHEVVLERQATADPVNMMAHGVGLVPTSQSIIGSQDVPYIYEDRISGKQFVDGLLKLYNMSAEERADLGRAGRQHVLNNYNFENYLNTWDEVLTELHEKAGSWETRKNYKSYEFGEIL